METFKNGISIVTIFIHVFDLYTILGISNTIFNVKCHFQVSISYVNLHYITNMVFSHIGL